jgi:hypothetical protein
VSEYVKKWNAGERVIRNNNTDPGMVISQSGNKVTVLLDAGGQKQFGANDLKRPAPKK